MPTNRYHELLGLPEDVTDPDFYLLLGIDRGQLGNGAVEERFKERMSKLQHIESPKHKEFIEFLKGELKKARVTLLDAQRRARYDEELKKEKVAQLRKLTGHILVDGTLSNMGEISLISEGNRMGLELPDIKQVIEEEMKRTGAQRVASKKSDAITQAASNAMMRETARALEDARIAARFADARARHAEQLRERAEEEAQIALQRAREAQELIRQTQKQVSVKLVEENAERQQVEARVQELSARLEEKQREIEALQRKMAEQAENLAAAADGLRDLAARGRRSSRMVLALLLAMGAALAGRLVRVYVPVVDAWMVELSHWTVGLGAGAAGVGLALLAAGNLALLVWLGGRPAKVPAMLLTGLLAALAFLAAAAYLK